MNTMKAMTATAITITARMSPVDSAPWRPSSSVPAIADGNCGHDAGQDDQRNAVADAARGDLLAQPHQEHGAAGERDRGRDQEEEAGFADDAAGALQPDADAVGLERGQHHGEIPGVLVHDLAARLAFLLERFERGRDRRHQLDDDRGRDVGHDVEREDRHPVDAAAGEHVEHAENAAGLGVENLLPGGRIDAGQRNIGAQAIDQQRADREPDALLELFGFGERREVEIGRQLFRCRNHQSLLPPRPGFATVMPRESGASSTRRLLNMLSHQFF